MKKKWLAGILTICMLLSILPTNAFAAGEGADAETGEQENAAIEGTLDTVGGTDSNEVLEEELLAESGDYDLPAEITVESFTGKMTVYDGETYYATMVEALAGIHKTDKHTLWCKPNADVGAMTHGHVCADLTVYGNDAFVSAGEREFEVDMYKDVQGSTEGSDLTGNVALTVNRLHGAGAWGYRRSEYVVDIQMNDCENMQRVYISGTQGTTNVTLTNCTFDGSHSDLKANNCAVYSNSAGTITVDGCTFANVSEPININHKAESTEKNVIVENTKFADCGLGTANDQTWAAPIRVVASADSEVNLSVDSCKFTYTNGNQSRNGDILVGDGRTGEKGGHDVAVSIKATAAEVQFQTPGYYGADGNIANEGNMVTLTTEKGETVTTSLEEQFAVAKIGEVTFASLKEALTAATDGDTITLLKDVTYAGSEKGLFNITKSITLDGAGHTISGYGTRGSNSTTLAINHEGTERISVTLKNLKIKNGVDSSIKGEGRAVETRGNIASLTLENCNFECTGTGNTQVLTIGGSQADAAKLAIKNSTLTAGNAGYPVVVFNPIDAAITDGSTLSGYGGIYFKGENGSEGSHGSVVNAVNSHFDCPNVHSAEGSNNFGVFALEDDHIEINLTDCTVNAEAKNTANQAVLQENGYAQRQSTYTITISGENSYINGKLLDDGWTGVERNYTITGGTYTENPTPYLPTGYAAFPTADGKFVVGKAVTSITLSDATLSLALNESHTLTAKVEPDDAYAQTVTWASNNETVATVGQNGVVTAEAIGKATITATIGDKSASCEVTVSYAPVANVTLDHDKLSMVEGSTTTITATVTPDNADKAVVWTSDKESIATVVGGTITAVAPGTATITATVGGKFASCAVTVVAKPDEDETAVVPSVEEPAVKVEAELPQAVEQAVTEAAQSVDAGQALSGAAQQEAAVLDRNEAKQEQLLDKAKDEGITGSETTPVVLYTQTYLEIQVTEAKAEGSEVTSVTMDITPKMQIVASTAASSADIDLSENGNAVVVESGDLSLTRAEITVQLPSNFARKLVFIRHEAEKGVFHYQDQADAQGVVTFTTRHGFSPFTFSLTDGAAAWIGSAGYDTLAQAVDAVDNGETITLARDNSEEIQVNREVSFSVDPGEHKFDQKNITAGRRYDMSVTEKDGVYTYTFERESTGGSTDRPEGDYAIRVEAGKNGTVKVSPSRADKGDTVTITVKPNKGYELDELIVTDSKGNELELTEKGENKFTFKMPGSRVTVEATFQAVEDAPEVPQMVNPFIDVNENAYYYDAVLWAVEKGITGGTTAATFSPDDACTRAQMVTFLWRANGSPVVDYAMNFTDVPADAYYAEAVRWAVSQGITAGTSATTFDPNATVTRGQTVTFLWRANGSPVVAGDSFADVAADAYYAPAVAWAVREGITSGVGAETFAPSADCTRGQIVTFLYRDMAK